VCLFNGFAGRLFFLLRDAETTAKEILAASDTRLGRRRLGDLSLVL
jgi:hypothetical protein